MRGLQPSGVRGGVRAVRGVRRPGRRLQAVRHRQDPGAGEQQDQVQARAAAPRHAAEEAAAGGAQDEDHAVPLARQARHRQPGWHTGRDRHGRLASRQPHCTDAPVVNTLHD